MKKKISISFLFFISIIFYSNAQTGIWEELHPTNSPSPRLAFGMAEIGDGKVLIFGGDAGTNLLDDTWIYNYQTNSWTEVNTNIHPSKRFGHRVSKIIRNKVILFGGWNPPMLLNDTWIFDLDSLTWTELKLNNMPTVRRNFGFAQLKDNKILLFGGDALGYVNDTWIFNLEDSSWTLINSDYYSTPPPCEGVLMSQIDTGKVILYGGWRFILLDETWLYDDSFNRWFQIIPKNNSIPIVNSSMARITNNEVVYWGGDSRDSKGSGNYDELWIFNLIESSWRIIKTNIKPDGRFSHNIVNFDNNRILLFGGYNNTEYRWHNDTWLFKLQQYDYKDDENKTNNNIKSYIIFDNGNKLKIKSSNVGKFDYQFYDIFGNIISKKEDVFINSDNMIINIDLMGFPNGLYFLVTHQNNNVEVSKVLISR